MRPGRGPEGYSERRLFAQHRRQPIIAAYDERDRGPVLGAPPLQPPRKGRAVHALAVLVQDDDGCVVRNDIGDGDRFFQHPAPSISGMTIPDFDDVQSAHADAATGVSRTFSITLR